MKFTVATLTCNDRACLFDVFDDFYKHTEGEPSEWIVYAQGCSTEFLQRIRAYFDEKDTVLFLFTNKENEGYSKGMNTLWNYCSVYEYVLFLEDDWRLWDQAPRNWLSVSCSILEERPEIDILFLRKYMSDHEKWQYGWTRHIPYQCFEDRLRFNYEDAMKSTEPFTYHGLTYQQIPHFMYSANPCLFKVAAYKKCNIFPMQEFNDKHSAHGTWNTSSDMSCEWGYAEALSMEKTESLYTLYLKDGVFYHNTG